MGFPEFKFENRGRSFVPHEEVLDFFDSYAREFRLSEVVKLAHNVVNVTPADGERWEVSTNSTIITNRARLDRVVGYLLRLGSGREFA